MGAASGGQSERVALVDRKEFGRRLRAARISAGFSRAEDLCGELGILGASCSPRSLYAYERGEGLPSADLLLAILVTLRPPGGLRFFYNSLREDARTKLEEVLSSR